MTERGWIEVEMDCPYCPPERGHRVIYLKRLSVETPPSPSPARDREGD